ncbi:MAG: hypothetical protein IRZ04_21845 [Rhodospirillales bacterium]|nr:hypothetical protein [Rhodospirillales bacterium]
MQMRSRPGHLGQGNRRRFPAGVVLVLLAAVLATGIRQGQAAATASPVPPPVAPYHAGDKIRHGEAPTGSVSPLGSGCERVPSTGYLAYGAAARTTGEYANYWSWSAASAGEPFDWWVYTSTGLLYASGYSSAGGGSVTTPANISYWKVKNLDADPQAWNACWSG